MVQHDREMGPELTSEQKQLFHRQGFVQVPGVVPRLAVDAALWAINNSLGAGIPPERVAEMREQSFCPELQRDPTILGLLHGPAWALAESLVGRDRIRAVHAGQIALCFPTTREQAPPLRPHVDGQHSKGNGLPAGLLARFTLLVGVLLSDVPSADCGNFTVWPGTHRAYEAYLLEHGPRSLIDGGMPPVALPDPLQITGRAGDAVLAHYQLGHAAAVNLSPHVRYAAFFRLRHVDCVALGLTPLTDIWLEYEGLGAS